MDAKLFVFFALFAAVFVHENNAQLSIPTLAEVQASVDAATAKLAAEVQAQTTKATTAAGLLINDIQTFAVEKTELAKAEATKVMTDLQVQIEAEVTKRGGVLAKLQECAKEHQTEIEAFKNATIKSITGCVTEKVQTAVDIVTSILTSSKTIGSILTDLKSNMITSCPDPAIASTFNTIAQELCDLKIVGIATAKVAEQAAIISANIAGASVFIASLSTLQVDLPACFSQRAAKAAVSSLPIVATLAACTVIG
nr:AT-rich 24kDa protein [Limnephilus flavicornis]